MIITKRKERGIFEGSIKRNSQCHPLSGLLNVLISFILF